MPLKIAVVGATGTVGQELVRVLEQSPLDIGRFVPLASRASIGRKVEFRGDEWTVRALGGEDLEQADLAFVASRGDIERGVLDEALDEGVRIVDLSGTWDDEPGVPTVALTANPEDLEALREVGVVHAAGPLTLTMTSLLGPLHAGFGVLGARGTATLPATLAGRAGTEELSDQVVALFNSREPRRTVFPEGLAFDLPAVWGAVGEDGWSRMERRVAEETVTLLGLDRAVVAVTATLVPVFAGLALSLHVVTDGRLTAAGAHEAFAPLGTLQLVEHPRELAVRRRVGQGRVAVGRLRDDPGGAGLHLWASCDPLRLVAANAVSLGVHVLRERL